MQNFSCRESSGLMNHHDGKRAGSAVVAGGEGGGGGVHQVVFWSCDPRALGPDSSSKKCSGRKSSYFPKTFVTIQSEQTVFLLKYLSDLGFLQLTLSKLNPGRCLLGLSRTSIPGQSRGPGMPEKAFPPITSSPPPSGCSL